MFLLVFVSLLCLFATLIWIWGKRKHQYWSDRGIPGPKPLPLIGHFHTFLRHGKYERHRWQDDIHKEFGPIVGTYEFLTPVINVSDVELCKAIFIKDFDHFVDRRTLSSQTSEPIPSEMLNNLSGDKWRSLRGIISPTFSSGKIKVMTPLIINHTKALMNFWKKEIAVDNHQSVKDGFQRFTTDTIATCAFAMECDSFNNQSEEFAMHAKKALEFGLSGILKLAVITISPALFKALGLRFSSDSSDYFVDSLRAIYRQREQQKAEGRQRGDFLDLLMEAKEEANKKGSKAKYAVTEDTAIAQSVIFLSAGLETASSTLTTTAHLLARNKNAQDRLRDESRRLFKKYGEINYAATSEANYTEWCINESMRILPFSPLHERKCVKDYKLPGTSVTIPKGMLVGLPDYTLQNDPAYWQKPEKFRPERFDPEAGEVVPGTFMPFGLGPRMCIGMRFAMLEMKIALLQLVLEFELSPPVGEEKTIKMGKQVGRIFTHPDAKLILKTVTDK